MPREPEIPSAETWEDLYASIPRSSKYRKVASHAHGYGYDEGYNEARVEVLAELARTVNAGEDVAARINDWWDKLKRKNRIPDGARVVLAESSD